MEYEKSKLFRVMAIWQIAHGNLAHGYQLSAMNYKL